MKSLAPIAYFAFNRSSHSLVSLEAIKKNHLASASDLYIFCDGPRKNETMEGLDKIASLRAAVRSQQWCKNVYVIEQQENKGLFLSLTEGITQVVNERGKVIVVEDDVLVATGFLEYMNGMLDLYGHDEKVMHLSGFCAFEPALFEKEQLYFIYNHSFCWGWATWQRAWSHFNKNGYELMKEVKKKGITSYVNMDDTKDIYWGLKFTMDGVFQEWNYLWHTCIALNNGLCINPTRTLTNNFGFDGSGTHWTPGSEFNTPSPMVDSWPVKRIPLEEDKRIRKFIHQQPFSRRFIFLVKHYLRNFQPRKKRRY